MLPGQKETFAVTLPNLFNNTVRLRLVYVSTFGNNTAVDREPNRNVFALQNKICAMF